MNKRFNIVSVGTKIDTSHASETKARIVKESTKDLVRTWKNNDMNIPTKFINIQSLDAKIRLKAKKYAKT